MGIFENWLFKSVSELSYAVDGEAVLFDDKEIKGFSIDSRKVQKGDCQTEAGS